MYKAKFLKANFLHQISLLGKRKSGAVTQKPSLSVSHSYVPPKTRYLLQYHLVV